MNDKKHIHDRLSSGPTDGLFFVCEEKRREKGKITSDRMSDRDEKRAIHRETWVREKTNEKEKQKLCFQFSISML